ncbi:hypothetical protein [Chryseobacterium piscium]|jgi:hypothetical protein|uniref:hypothetical protein n=1 Tax=Chryseobacterium piscium TaxID=333702 RepID=UPI0013006D14|nr:hypothetical protein [Chryseobacterium piscium]
METLQTTIDLLGRIAWMLALLKTSGFIKTKKTKKKFRIILSFPYRKWLLAFVAWLF